MGISIDGFEGPFRYGNYLILFSFKYQVYCDSEILVGMQPLSPTYSYGPVMCLDLGYTTSAAGLQDSLTIDARKCRYQNENENLKLFGTYTRVSL